MMAESKSHQENLDSLSTLTFAHALNNSSEGIINDPGTIGNDDIPPLFLPANV